MVSRKVSTVSECQKITPSFALNEALKSLQRALESIESVLYVNGYPFRNVISDTQFNFIQVMLDIENWMSLSNPMILKSKMTKKYYVHQNQIYVIHKSITSIYIYMYTYIVNINLKIKLYIKIGLSICIEAWNMLYESPI